MTPHKSDVHANFDVDYVITYRFHGSGKFEA